MARALPELTELRADPIEDELHALLEHRVAVASGDEHHGQKKASYVEELAQGLMTQHLVASAELTTSAYGSALRALFPTSVL